MRCGPGQVLPNGQIADASTGIAETLEAVKEIYEQRRMQESPVR